MDSNTLFMQYAPKCFVIAFVIEVVLAIIYAIANRKKQKNLQYWKKGGALLFIFNTSIFFVVFCYLFFKPADIHEKVITLEPEVITEINVIEKENVIDVPSIMLPIDPKGNQAVIIDTTSIQMKEFMKDFYGENVYFFNNRQEATYLVKTEGVENYSGLDIAKIEYSEVNMTRTIELDDMNYQTIWVFSDLYHLDIISNDTKVMLYVPRQITEQEIQMLKQTNSDITIIAIEQIC